MKRYTVMLRKIVEADSCEEAIELAVATGGFEVYPEAKDNGPLTKKEVKTLQEILL